MAPRKQKTSKVKKGKKNEEKEMQPEANVFMPGPEPETTAQEIEAAQVEPEPNTEGIVTAPEKIKKISGGKRSVCAMHKVVVKRAQGKKFKIRYNDRGMPAGENRHTLQSYIGMLARTMVPIDIQSWPHVDPELKEKLWNDVESVFNVHPESRALVLMSAGTKWRQFKSNLTSDYVVPFAGQKKKLRKPPKKYAFVCKNAWRAFVRQRTNKNWMTLRKDQSERVKKRKYPHRTSRKGYIGLQEEEEKKGTFEPGEVPDRAILWKKARKRKDNTVDPEQEAINKKIDDLLESKRKGELHMTNSEDVLTIALETPEHSGRVRGVGGFVTPKSYFNTPNVKRTRITKAELMTRDRQRDEEMERRTQALVSQIEELKAMVKSSSNIYSPMSDKDSCQKEEPANAGKKMKTDVVKELIVELDCVAIDPTPPGKKDPQACELAVDTIENIVAFGMVFEDEEMNAKIHGVPMPSGCKRVLVDGSIKDDALVPVPVPGEIEQVHQAVGSHVAWPEELIIFPNVMKKKRQVGNKGDDPLKNLGTMFKNAMPKNNNVPSRFRLLYKHATTIMKETGMSIEIPCDAAVFGIEKRIYILHENVIALLEYQMIGQAAISAYIAYLHNLAREKNLLDYFGFFDPSATFTLNADFESSVVQRLREGNPDRIFFMPHNEQLHWILVVIWESDIYTLNPLCQPAHFPALETALVSALKTFNAQTGRSGSRFPNVHNLSGTPKQPGSHECGYCVMRYMRDIILSDDMYSFTTKWLLKSRVSYKKEVLHEVRLETLEYIENFM